MTKQKLMPFNSKPTSIQFKPTEFDTGVSGVYRCPFPPRVIELPYLLDYAFRKYHAITCDGKRYRCICLRRVLQVFTLSWKNSSSHDQHTGCCPYKFILLGGTFFTSFSSAAKYKFIISRDTAALDIFMFCHIQFDRDALWKFRRIPQKLIQSCCC